jgi:glutathione peroxidase
MRILARVAGALVVAVLILGASPAYAQQGKTGFDFVFETIDGKPMPLEQFKGKVLLLVNTASECGYTTQYAALQALHQKYSEKGLVVIGVPSDDFDQEKLSNDKIKDFCRTEFNITFPLTSKSRVTRSGAHPFYAWAKGHIGEAAVPKWNFHKLLVGRDGRRVTAFKTEITPGSKDLVRAVERELVPRTATGG